MKYWRINTDSAARHDVKTCDLWYEHGMVFTGDYDGNLQKHDSVLRKMEPGHGVYMHHSGAGIVGYGTVTEKWNGKIYEGDQRLLYRVERFEYRIRVDWLPEYDRRWNPLSVNGNLPYMGTYSQVDPKKWDISSVLGKLRK